MMIHEKMVSGQFLLDLKNEHANLLNAHHHNLSELHSQHHHQQQHALATHYLHHHQHHQQQQQQQAMQQHQPPSPPMDIYAAYAYQQHQQQLLNNASKFNNVINLNQHSSISPSGEPKAEVLDLSRRCDSVETPRKTPSPTHTNSSVGTISPPITSPPQQQQQQINQQPPLIPSNLLYSMHAQQQQLTMPTPLPAALATLYPALYYNNTANNVKLEPKSPNDSPSKTATPPMPKIATPTTNTTPLSTATDLLQTFASAAKSPSVLTTPISQPTTPTTSINVGVECKSPTSNTIIGRTAMPHLNMLATLEEKNTRPFKALPRDPLVIAANFAATDVLFENQRAERYKEFRKRLLEHIHNSNGGSRTVTNPKMRRTNSRSNAGSGCRSSSEERQDDQQSSKASNNGADESSDCDSNAGSFTDKMMTVNASNGGAESQQLNNSNSGCGVVKDAAYLERRRKNNAAAKKSRDRRRIKEDELAMRAEFLAQENVELVCQIKALKAQLAAYTSKVGA